MDELVPFGSRDYFILLGVLLFSRGMDFLSTWVATPNLELEANPIAKRMGWKIGIAVNILVSVGIALWALPAIMISTTSVLVASRNFQNAWLMRSLGEETYRFWMGERIRQTSLPFYLFCFAMQMLLILGVGIAIVFYSSRLVPFAVGWGIIGYAFAVAFYTILGTWRMRRTFNTLARRRIEHVFSE